MSARTARRVVVVGGGIGGLAAAILLGRAGHRVTLFEKHDTLGGRARVFTEDGFRFDMGPSWYLMPDVFEHFFALVGRRVEDYLTLHPLAPSYRIHLPDDPLPVDLYSDVARDGVTLSRFEPGAPEKLRRYIDRIGHEYALSMRSFVYRNANSPLDFLTWSTVRDGRHLPLLRSMHRHLSEHFEHPTVRRILEYQTLFLGSAPHKTPAVYGAMNYVDFAMGVFYPEGGIGAVIDALARLAGEFGVEIRTGAPVMRVATRNGAVEGVVLTGGEVVPAHAVVSNADLWFTETRMLETGEQSYPEAWWRKKVPAPSAFIVYLGIEGRAPSLTHHNLLFPSDWERSFGELFETPRLPTEMSLYVCCPSRTDPGVAPPGCENLFALQPIPAGTVLSASDRAAMEERVLDALESRFGVEDLRARIRVKRIYTVDDFAEDYNAFRGNALGGLAHSLDQSSVFRPSNVSKKVRGLYYVGAGTNPGIGMPICLISAELLLKQFVGDRSEGPLARFPD